MKPERISFNVSFDEARQTKLHSEIIKNGKKYIIIMIKVERDSFKDYKIIYNSEIKAEEKWFYLKRIKIKCHLCDELNNPNCNFETCVKEE
jgi:hypothetical protein